MPNRREFLASAASLALPQSAGWLPQFEPKVYPAAYTNHLYGSGQGRVMLLWKSLEHVGGYVPHHQRGNDCVGHAAALGVDTLAAIQAYHGQAEWRGKHSTEAIYAGSRIDIGIEKHGYRLGTGWLPNQIPRGGGSTCAWAIEWLKDYGALRRAKYGNYDLRKYNYSVTRAWADTGVPSAIDKVSKEHPLLSAVRVRGGWQQACDLIANGFPIILCSRQGFSRRYDSDGFLKPSSIWLHAMLLWGIDTKSSRPGGNIANSKGAGWVSGPKHKHGTPPGSIWADAKVIDKMLKQGIGYALSSFQGYPRQQLDYRFK